ncbi:hypothetical protein [Lentibacillus sediminis]|uniref:hypothetical protein n=1 Tax=Lentibacillus sediminis TaxID=1940529 RepID=UPI000C1C1851|nr:hypothetical protein [Lentibacillus sediminis]
MKINNTTEDFFRMYEADTSFQLDDYHQHHLEIFTTYFHSYCKKTEQKLTAAKERYPQDYEN